jgi:hypothetical protein
MAMQRSAVIAGASVLVVVSLASCAGQRQVPAPTPTAYLYNGCLVTPLQHAPFQPDRASSISAIPWIQAVPVSSGITGHLFYAPRPLPLSDPFIPLYTNGIAPGGGTTKILWTIENTHSSSELEITGTQLAPGHGSFQQTFPAASSPSTDYPSIVDVPTPGCWQLTLASGTVTGTVVFWVAAS